MKPLLIPTRALKDVVSPQRTCWPTVSRRTDSGSFHSGSWPLVLFVLSGTILSIAPTTAAQSVSLTWTASTSVVAGYNVYRGTQSGGPYTLINSSLDTGTTYSDATVHGGQSYYYVATAVTSNGVESVHSNEAQVSVPYPSRLAFTPASVSFGTVSDGTSSSQTVTLTDTGSSSVVVSGEIVTGTGFSTSGLSVPLTLEGGQSTTFTATFTPAGAGPAAGTVSVVSNASNSPTALSLTGTGTTSSGTVPVITSPTMASVAVGTAVSYQITATNSPTSYGATGLPAGLSVNTASGLISGTPTTAGTSMVTLRATNSGGTGSATLTLTINPTCSFCVVQVIANASSGSANSLSLSFPQNTVAGHLILVAFDYVSTATPSSVTDSQGNVFTEVGSQLTTPGQAKSRVYYAPNIKGGADTVTVTLSANSGIELYVTEYTGVSQTNPIDAQAGAAGSAGAVSSGNATTTTAGDLIFGYCAADWACTAGSGFTALSTFNDNLIEDMVAGNAGTYAATGSANNGWTMQMVALRPAARFVQSVANAASGSATSLSLSFPTNTKAGDLILVAFDYAATSTPSSVTDSQGNAFAAVGSQLISPGQEAARVYYAANIRGGADTVTVTLSANSGIELYLTEYSGVSTVSPIDGQAGASGSAGPVSSGNATTTTVGDVIFGYCAADWACTAGSGFTARSTFDDNLIEDMVAGSAGTYAATGSANNGWTMQMVALKP